MQFIAKMRIFKIMTFTKKKKQTNWFSLNTHTHTHRIYFFYTVNSVRILEREEDLRLPLKEGRHLVLTTCYPFYYTGHAPNKYVLIATKSIWTNKSAMNRWYAIIHISRVYTLAILLLYNIGFKPCCPPFLLTMGSSCYYIRNSDFLPTLVRYAPFCALVNAT